MKIGVLSKLLLVLFATAVLASATANTECVITPTGVSAGKDDYSNYLFVTGNVTISGTTYSIWWRLGLSTDARAQQRYSTAMMALATGLKLTIAYDLPTNTGCQTAWWISDDHINYVLAKP